MNEIFDHRTLRQNAFGLVDAAMAEHLPAGIIAEALVPSFLAASAHLMPKLIDIRNAPDDQLYALLDCFARRSKKRRAAARGLVSTDERWRERVRSPLELDADGDPSA